MLRERVGLMVNYVNTVQVMGGGGFQLLLLPSSQLFMTRLSVTPCSLCALRRVVNHSSEGHSAAG